MDGVEVVEASIIESDVSGVSSYDPGAVGQAWTNSSEEDDDHDRRPQRRRYEEPLVVKVRKQLLSIAESVSGSRCAGAVGKKASLMDV